MTCNKFLFYFLFLPNFLKNRKVRDFVKKSLEKQDEKLLRNHLGVLENYVKQTKDEVIQRIIFKIEHMLNS